MGIFDSSAQRELKDAIKALQAQIADLRIERQAQLRALEAAQDASVLRQEIEGLRISKDRLVEDNEREIREVTHKVGLERRRQQFEAEQARQGIEVARQEATLAVREANLASEKQVFADQMKFQEDRFKTEVGYLRDLMKQILDRLPTVTVDRQIADTTTSVTKRSA